MKKIIPLSILFLGVIVSLIIIGFSGDSSQNVSSANLSDTLPPGLVGAYDPVYPKEDAVLSGTNPDGSLNLTSAIAKRIASELASQNPEGPKDFLGTGDPSIQALRPDLLVNQVLAQELTQFDYDTFRPSVDPHNLIIIHENSSAHMSSYIRDLLHILTERSESVSVNPSNFRPQDFAALEATLSTIIDELYALPVPESLVALHAEQIRLLTAERNIFGSLSHYENDFFKALVAVRTLQDIEREAGELATQFNLFIRTNNIEI